MDIPISLASCNRREDTQDIPFFQDLIFFPVDPVNQNDLWNLFGYFEPGQDILNPSRLLDLHLVGESTAPLREIISKRRK